MFLAFVYFMAGVLTVRVLQFFLSITPSYNIFKHTEYTSLAILAQMHLLRIQALRIVEVCYKETESEEEFNKIKNQINSKYNSLITDCLSRIKNNLPYKVNYDNLEDAITTYLQNTEEKKDG